MSQELYLFPLHILSKHTRTMADKTPTCSIHQPDPSITPENYVPHAEVTMREGKRPKVIKRLGVTMGATDHAATIIGQGYTLYPWLCQAAVVKR
jgi:hypothetical protein